MNKINKTISQIWEDNYVVPIYQRNYAWGEDQITQLLQDIYDASQNEGSNYFIGSLVVLLRTDGIFEVIDGQQRLTTLHLICKKLGILKQSHLSYDSRPEVEDFFNDLFAFRGECEEFLEDYSKRDTRKIYHLVEALDILESANIHTHAGHDDDMVVRFKTLDDEVKNRMAEYLNNNVILVRTILPDDTDVAAYFEIMNNRGEQLQEHEIVKALMMKSLDKEQRQVFASIWDACSQMNVPIQRSLSSQLVNSEYPIFGDDYSSIHEDYIQIYKLNESKGDFLSMDEILAKSEFEMAGNDKHPEETGYSAIMDFPNFLMLVFKTYDGNCQLNANYLQETYNSIFQTLGSMEFVGRLLKFRTVFDRFVVKNTGSDDDEESIHWIMKKPYRDKNALKFRNTFSMANDEPDENEAENGVQKRIVKQLSMLQVTFRNKKYKNWLFDYLKFLCERNLEDISAGIIIKFLDEWMLSFYNQLLEKYSLGSGEWAFESLGVDTPHFLFNFIDYLYWVESCNPRPEHHISYIEEVQDFDFKYYNSVEHHLPQSYENVDQVNIDNIGNLCLISRSGNSSLNDKAPKEKARIVPGLSPKRRIMYTITQNNNGIWDRKHIEEHCEDIKNLLELRSSILNI